MFDFKSAQSLELFWTFNKHCKNVQLKKRLKTCKSVAAHMQRYLSCKNDLLVFTVMWA